MENNGVKLGKLAFREEGKYWNAYIKDSDLADEPILLGSILFVLILKCNEAKTAFMMLMEVAYSDFIYQSTGMRVGFENAKPAPEIERAGHA